MGGYVLFLLKGSRKDGGAISALSEPERIWAQLLRGSKKTIRKHDLPRCLRLLEFYCL